MSLMSDIGTAVKAKLDLKVDKITGKGLSTEDYSTAEKTKLAGIAAGAQVNVGTDLSLGTITGTTIPLNSSTGTDVSLPSATTTLAGLMSGTDKSKLDGIATGANNYSLPVASSTILGGVKAGTNVSIDANGVISANDSSVAWSEVTSKPTTISGYGITDAVSKVTSTDNAIARFNGTTGDMQNSGVVIDDSDRLLIGTTPSGLNTLGQLIVNQPSSGYVNLALTNKTNDSYSYIYNDGTALKISNSYNLTAGFKPIILQTGGSDKLILGINGNMLLGTTTDNSVDKLQVNGSIKATGAITAIRETKISMTGNNIDLSLGNLFTKTISGATTFTVSNVLGSGNANSFILELTNAGSAVITWFSGIKWANGLAPTLTTAGVDILGFYSHDGGTTWRGSVIAKDSK